MKSEACTVPSFFVVISVCLSLHLPPFLYVLSSFTPADSLTNHVARRYLLSNATNQAHSKVNCQDRRRLSDDKALLIQMDHTSSVGGFINVSIVH